MKKKRKKTTPKYKYNSKIKNKNETTEVDKYNDKENDITGAKSEKKDILKNSNEKPFKIISLKNEGNYIKRKNANRHNSSELKVIIDNYKIIIY